MVLLLDGLDECDITAHGAAAEACLAELDRLGVARCALAEQAAALARPEAAAELRERRIEALKRCVGQEAAGYHYARWLYRRLCELGAADGDMAAILLQGRRSVPGPLESERKGSLSSVVVKRKRVLCGWCRGAPGHRGCPDACQMA